MKIGWEWYLMGSSVVAGLILLAVILAIKKSQNKTTGFWKIPFVFLWANLLRPKKLIMWTIIVGAGYGIYLSVNYCLPPKSERLFKQIIANQIEVQTKDETDNLEETAKSSGTSTLSPDELKLAQKNRLDAAKKRKILEAMLEKPETKAAKLAQAPVYKWVFEFKPEPEDIINARKNKVDQICYRENDVVNKPYFDEKEIRFKYKTSKGKIIYAILDKKSPSETHFLGIVDLPELPKGRKLIIRLKETSTPDKFEGLIETWDGENLYPQIPAFLKKVQVQ